MTEIEKYNLYLEKVNKKVNAMLENKNFISPYVLSGLEDIKRAGQDLKSSLKQQNLF